jgi:hypothetical protein
MLSTTGYVTASTTDQLPPTDQPTDAQPNDDAATVTDAPGMP